MYPSLIPETREREREREREYILIPTMLAFARSVPMNGQKGQLWFKANPRKTVTDGVAVNSLTKNIESVLRYSLM